MYRMCKLARDLEVGRSYKVDRYDRSKPVGKITRSGGTAPSRLGLLKKNAKADDGCVATFAEGFDLVKG